MKIIGWIILSVTIIYGFMVLLFILDLTEIVEVKGEKFKSFIHFTTLLATPVLVTGNLLAFGVRKFALLLYLPSCLLVVVVIRIIAQNGIVGYLFSTGSYHTQTILYQNKTRKSKRIEFQMQDVGALGYNERTVEVTYLTSWLMITKTAKPEEIKSPEWVKVMKEVNELGLKY